MTSALVIASAVEVGLVVVAALIFLAMIAAAVALIVWFAAGVISATHRDPVTHH